MFQNIESASRCRTCPERVKHIENETQLSCLSITPTYTQVFENYPSIGHQIGQNSVGDYMYVYI